MYITAQPGHSLIEVIKLESVKRFGPEVVKKVLLSGGLCAVHIPKGGAMNLPLSITQMTKKFELDYLTMLEGTSVIQVVDVYRDRLATKDLDALILHEEGHIHHGHEMPGNMRGKQIVNGILIDLQAELQADAYAASKVGKRQMAIALTHAAEVMVELAATKIGTVPRNETVRREALNQVMFNPQFRARIAALQ